jgi:hypothetical protein
MKIQYVILSKIMSFLTGWIPVDKKLPKHKHKNVQLGIICFCLLQGYYPAVCLFHPYDKKWYRENGNQDVTSYVSHWKKSTAPDIFFHEWTILKGRDVFNPLVSQKEAK